MSADRSRHFGVTREGSVRRLAFCLTLAITAALAVSAHALSPKSVEDAAGDVHVPGGKGKSPPTLVFACEGSSADSQQIFSQRDVISDLKTLHASVALGLPDLTPERARLVSTLNKAGIPVTAGLALPGAQGYYLNAGNAPAAEGRFADFEKWTAANGLRWAGVALDIEPSIQDFDALKQGGKWKIALTLIGRYFQEGRVERARESYAALISKIRARGYPVDTVQFPFIADTRAVHSTVLERLAGIVDVKGDLEVLMLYTSFNPSLDSALIWVYGPDAQGIAVGIVSGSGPGSDPNPNPHFAPLNWEEFSRDLLVAHHFSQVIAVFNLQGCVRQGFLHRLTAMNWDQAVVIPADSVHKALRLRMRIQRAIWAGSHLQYFGAVILLVLIAIILTLVRRHRRFPHP